MDDKDIKQVILVRTDLKMPIGKIAAQVAHASMAVILNKMGTKYANNFVVKTLMYEKESALHKWIDGSFTKVILGVNSEQEMLQIYDNANLCNLLVSKITDEGRTCFNKVPTNTVIAIGPGLATTIDQLTGHLKLLK